MRVSYRKEPGPAGAISPTATKIWTKVTNKPKARGLNALGLEFITTGFGRVEETRKAWPTQGFVRGPAAGEKRTGAGGLAQISILEQTWTAGSCVYSFTYDVLDFQTSANRSCFRRSQPRHRHAQRQPEQVLLGREAPAFRTER